MSSSGDSHSGAGDTACQAPRSPALSSAVAALPPSPLHQEGGKPLATSRADRLLESFARGLRAVSLLISVQGSQEWP